MGPISLICPFVLGTRMSFNLKGFKEERWFKKEIASLNVSPPFTICILSLFGLDKIFDKMCQNAI